MLVLATLLVACPAPLTPCASDADRTLAIAGTEVQVRLPLPGWHDDETRLKLLRQTGGEHVLATGTLGQPGTDDVRVTIMGGPAAGKSGDDCRKGVLGERLLGMGIGTVGGYASAQTIRSLNPPYREVDRHVFLVGADAMAHVQVIALEHEEPERFGDQGFEAIAKGARFAVVRRTAWDDLPARYLELSNAAAARTDGVAATRDAAAAPGAGWIEKLVALEHAHAVRSTEPYLIELGTAVRAELAAKSARTREEDAGLLLAEDGLGLALLRAGQVDAAAAHIAAARELAPRFGDRCVAGVAADLACLCAAKKDVDGVVAALTEANAKDPAVRYKLMREPLMDPVRSEPRVDELLKILLKAPSNRRLGR